METEFRERAGAYLFKGKLMQLATVSGSQPWLCQVWYGFDPATWRLSFTSNTSRRHSHEIRAHSAVAGAVMADVPEGLGQKVRGVCFEGRATEADGELLDYAYELYALRWPVVRNMFSVSAILDGSTPMRMYVIEMTKVVFFDEEGSPSAPRQEFDPRR